MLPTDGETNMDALHFKILHNLHILMVLSSTVLNELTVPQAKCKVQFYGFSKIMKLA